MSKDLTLIQLGQAIYCNCYVAEYDRHKILGSITANGILEILRGHKNKTIIETHELLISCESCGFRKHIRIESMAVNRPTYETH